MQTLTIFYTYNLAGNLEVLPRLYSYMQTLQDDYDVARPLVLDLGRSCVPDVWHCEVTEGRSTVIVLDGMGYHAINTQDIIDNLQRQQLKRVITSALIDERQSWRYNVPPERDDGILISITPSPALRLCIVASPAPETTLEARILTLAEPPRAPDVPQVGVVQVAMQDEPTLVHHAFHGLPDDAKASPIIINAVDFMLEEARYYQSQQK
jgi:hypothetical protein